MAQVEVTEYSQIGIPGGDSHSQASPILPGTYVHQHAAITIGATAVRTSTAFQSNSRLVRIAIDKDADCRIEFGDETVTATANSPKFYKDSVEVRHIDGVTHLSVIAA